MRRVILAVAVSLDGLIEGPKGEYDWCPPPSQNEMREFLDKIDVIFYGRKSYELAGSSAFPGKISYVFSNTLKKVNEKNTHLISGDVKSKVNDIKNESGKDIWLFGGASLVTTFMNESLVDEIWLGVVPVVLGNGKPLFQNINQRSYFKLIDSTPRNGYLSLSYTYQGNKKSK